TGVQTCALPISPVAASTGELIGIGAAAGAAAGLRTSSAAAGAATATPVGMRDRRTLSSPSLISISARLDSSSRSMSFLILRRSMMASVLQKGGRSARQARERSVQGVAVAVGAEPADHADRLVAGVAVLAEGFAGGRVGQVDLDERDRHRRQRVAQGDGGMGEGGGVDQDEGGAVAARGLHPVDQGVLGVGLE